MLLPPADLFFISASDYIYNIYLPIFITDVLSNDFKHIDIQSQQLQHCNIGCMQTPERFTFSLFSLISSIRARTRSCEHKMNSPTKDSVVQLRLEEPILCPISKRAEVSNYDSSPASIKERFFRMKSWNFSMRGMNFRFLL